MFRNYFDNFKFNLKVIRAKKIWRKKFDPIIKSVAKLVLSHSTDNNKQADIVSACFYILYTRWPNFDGRVFRGRDQLQYLHRAIRRRLISKMYICSQVNATRSFRYCLRCFIHQPRPDRDRSSSINKVYRTVATRNQTRKTERNFDISIFHLEEKPWFLSKLSRLILEEQYLS